MELMLIETDEQIAALARLASEIWHEHFPGIISMAQVDYMVDKFQSVPSISDQIHNQGYQYFFIIRNGCEVGYTGIHGDSDRLFLSKLYVRKNDRGNGCARVVIDLLADHCRNYGYHSIWLTVNRQNTDTIQIYERLGFSTIRTQTADIGNGFVMDDFVMEKEISYWGICDTNSATPSHSSS